MRPGDKVLALPSSGIHSNGYSLVRKVFDVERCDLGKTVPELGRPLGEALLVPTRIYVKPVLAVLAQCRVSGISHITGGGFFENIPRAVPDGSARRSTDPPSAQPRSSACCKAGRHPGAGYVQHLHMGVGMSLIVAAADAERAPRSSAHRGRTLIV
jgi:phosphoribosylformylglycinamidine cyclo-ligase